jgi:hypothetical protein
LDSREYSVRKFKAGSSIVRTRDPEIYAPLGFVTVVAKDYRYTDNLGERVSIREDNWELESSGWTTENNELPFGELTDVQQGALLLCKHHGFDMVYFDGYKRWQQASTPTWSPDKVYRKYTPVKLITIGGKKYREDELSIALANIKEVL